MLNVNQLIGFGVGDDGFSVAYVTYVESGSSLTTYTFSGASLGAAHPKRKVIVSVHGTGTNITAVTIGGVSATAVIGYNDASRHASIYIADVPTGETGDIVVQFAGGNAGCRVGIFRAVNMSSGTAHATATKTVGDPLTQTINIPENGFLIVAYTGASTSTVTWTGPTEMYDGTPSSRTMSAGFIKVTSAVTPQSVSVDIASNDTSNTMVLASWAP